VIATDWCYFLVIFVRLTGAFEKKCSSIDVSIAQYQYLHTREILVPSLWRCHWYSHCVSMKTAAQACLIWCFETLFTYLLIVICYWSPVEMSVLLLVRSAVLLAW